MIANSTTSKSETRSNEMLMAGTEPEIRNTPDEIFISMSSCGIIIGKPRIAMIAAFCCALAAMAARKVNTRLKLQPPKKTIPTKMPVFLTG